MDVEKGRGCRRALDGWRIVMNLKFVKRRLLIPSIILAGCVGLFHYVTGVFDYIPRLRGSAKSPDGTLTVKVYQKRLMPRPFFPRMGALAEVYDGDGNLVYQNIIFRDSDWDDTLGEAFKQISFEGEEIRISPGFYDPSQAYVIRKSELKKLE
jgi:hypothetical protein